MIVTTEDAVFFWQSDSSFSNWAPAEFTHQGIKFENSEAALMYMKARLFGDAERAVMILKDQRPWYVKRRGREVRNFVNSMWSLVRFEFMTLILVDKFRQNPEMKQELMDTGDKEIVEASPYDLIWGIGLAPDDNRIYNRSNWDGDNLLGKSLMEVRKIIHEFG